MNTQLKEKYDAYNEKRHERNALKSIQENERKALLEERIKPLENQIYSTKDAINSELNGKYKAMLDALWEEELALSKAVDLERIEQAKTRWYPENTIVCRWEYGRFSDKPKLSGERGIVKIWTEDSDYPSNLSKYSIPEPGTIVIYDLKKDGTQSKRFESYNENYPNKWIKEGEPYPVKKTETVTEE